MKYTLKDDWKISGNDFEEFKDSIKELSDLTKFKLIPCRELGFFHEIKKDAENGYPVMRITADLVEGYNEKNDPLKLGVIPKRAVNTELYEESMASNGFLASHERTFYYVSPEAKTTLLMRANLSGEYATQKSCLMTQTIMESLSKQEKGMTLVYREVNNDNGGQDRKVFSFLSQKYTPLDQKLLPDLAEKVGKGLGRAETRNWSITQNFTQIHLEFPEAADEISVTYGLPKGIVPGVRFMSSDTGQSSVHAYATYRFEDETKEVFIDEYSHKHMGEISVEEILENVDGKLLNQLRKVPEALVSLMGNVVGLQNPEADPALNRTMVEDAIKEGSKNLGLVKELGLKRVNKLIDELKFEVNEDEVYTEFSLAMMFMSLPSRVKGMSDVMLRNLQRACGRAPFVSYGKKVKNEVKDKDILLDDEDFEGIFLMPGEAF